MVAAPTGTAEPHMVAAPTGTAEPHMAAAPTGTAEPRQEGGARTGATLAGPTPSDRNQTNQKQI